jgi:hypothetical protein
MSSLDPHLEALLSDLDAANVRRHLETITSEIPSRLAGSANGKRMAEYSLAGLKEAGVEARIHEIPGLVSFPDAAELAVLTPQPQPIEAFTLGHSTVTPPGGIEGEMVDVGSGAFSDYEGIDARGKIILTELSYSPARHEKQRIAALMGASGCVMMNWGRDDNEAVPFGSVKSAWGNPTPEGFEREMPSLPCVGIARTEGLKLRQRLANGPVRLSMTTHVDNGWRPVQVTHGAIKGATDDFVLLGGHQDSWFGPQATDNAAGSSCLLELARVFSKHRQHLRRGITFGFWTGHETGTMIGSSWFADKHWDMLDRHAVAYVQIDQPCDAGTTCWETSSNPELKAFHQAIETEELGGRELFWHPAAKIGDSSFFGLGIPMMTGQGMFTAAELAVTANAAYGWWHHSIHNDLSKIQWDYLPTHLRIYARYVWELATAPVLPFEFKLVADRILARLRELTSKDDPLNLADVIALATSFSAVAGRLDERAAACRMALKQGGAVDEAAIDALNACLKTLSRLTIPLLSTAQGRYGHDPYGLTAQSTTIPSLYDAIRLVTLPQGSERWMIETALKRARNRVADSLRQSCAIAEATVSRLA